MSNHSLPQNLQAIYRNTGLRFLLMFLGIVVAPVMIFVNSGADLSPQNTTNQFCQFLMLGSWLFAALLIGWTMFKRKVRSLSISTPPAAKSAADQGVI